MMSGWAFGFGLPVPTNCWVRGITDRLWGTGRRRAAHQAGLLYLLSGLLGLADIALPGPTAMDRGVVIAIYAGAVAVGTVTFVLPWQRWRPEATLVLVPMAFGLICALDRFGGTPPTVYGVYFVVVFAWIGIWHAPRTSVWMAPLAAAVYVVPFLTTTSPQPDALRSVGIAIPACVMVGEVLARSTRGMREAQQAQEATAAALARAAVTDDLTGLGNRRHGDRLLEGLSPGDALLLLDLDRFKAVNDTFGHAEGDRLLADLGHYLRGQLRGADRVARYGGEEFVIVLPGAGEEARDVAERLVTGWRLTNPVATLSVGVAVHRAGSRPALTFGEADRALYEAKAAGRDQVAFSSGHHRPDLTLLRSDAPRMSRPAP